jgi:hypothetical protein
MADKEKDKDKGEKKREPKHYHIFCEPGKLGSQGKALVKEEKK